MSDYGPWIDRREFVPTREVTEIARICFGGGVVLGVVGTAIICLLWKWIFGG